MSRKGVFEDKRLLGSLEYIDKKYISEAMEYYDKIPAQRGEPQSDQRSARRSLKYVLALAVCLILISAVIPVVSYLTGRSVTPPVGAFTEETMESEISAEQTDETTEQATEKITEETVEETTAPPPETTEEEIVIPEPPGGLTFIEHVGEVPDEFKDIVKNNLLGGGYHIGDVIVHYYQDGNRYRVIARDDKSGKALTEALVGAPMERVSEVFVDSEKNLIVALRVDTTIGSKPSGYYKIVKIDQSGKTVFEKSMSTVNAGYDYMIESDAGYIFVGTCDGEKSGTLTTTDISAVLLSREGVLLGHRKIGGDDYDTLYHVAKNGDGVSIYFFMHTKDRNGSYQRVDIDGGLGLPKYTKITMEDIPDSVTFTIDGKPYYEMTDFFTAFEWNKTAGSKVIEYDDFVLLVYSRYTSNYDKKLHGMLSSIQPSSFYTETVYEAYTKSGELLWLSAVDSTDYDFLREYYKDK